MEASVNSSPAASLHPPRLFRHVCLPMHDEARHRHPHPWICPPLLASWKHLERGQGGEEDETTDDDTREHAPWLPQKHRAQSKRERERGHALSCHTRDSPQTVAAQALDWATHLGRPDGRMQGGHDSGSPLGFGTNKCPSSF